MTKKIDTLVDDIYELLDKGSKDLNKVNLIVMGVEIQDAMRKQLWVSASERKPTLRMSNIGKPCTRATWYDMNGDDKAEPFTPQTKLKFIIGDIVESVLLFLAKEAGHTVEGEQKEIEIDGIKGHIDAIIDGELVDVKSASSFSMNKFRKGTLPKDDPFGYISQISGYANALDKKAGTFLAFDKSSGALITYTHKEIEDTSKKIASLKEVVDQPEPPERCFSPVTEKKTGKKKLNINCSYCSHKMTCWEDQKIRKAFSGRSPVFYIGEEDNGHTF